MCGFIVFGMDGIVVYELVESFEYFFVFVGYYNEGCLENKGVEFEVVEFGIFCGCDFLFVGLECLNVVGVYDVIGGVLFFY